MAAAPDSILVHRNDQTVTFRVTGEATMFRSMPLRRFAEQCLAGGAHLLRIDLRHCTYMDSTFLGTLLFLKRAVECRGQGGLALVSPSAFCRQLLKQMNLEDFYPVVTEEELSAISWTELDCGVKDVNTFKRTVVQAHQELACLPGPGGEPFREVVRVLGPGAEAEKPQ
jgi:anti-anti-sigma factor